MVSAHYRRCRYVCAAIYKPNTFGWIYKKGKGYVVTGRALSREDSAVMPFHLSRGLGDSSAGGGITGVLTHAWISP